MERCVCLLFAGLLAAAAFAAETPTVIPLDGNLEASAGHVVTLVVSIYARKDDATPLWTERQTVRVDGEGKYTLSIGATLDEGISTDVFASGRARWIGIAVEGESEQPRSMIVTVPYALHAREADTIGGRSINDFVLADDLPKRVDTIMRLPRVMPGETISTPRMAAPIAKAPQFVGKPAALPTWSMATGFPNEGLHLRGPQNQIVLEDSAEAQSTNNYWYITRSGGTGSLEFRHLAANGLIGFSTNGSLGIGTVTPAYPLDVFGAAIIRSTLLIGSSQLSAAGLSWDPNVGLMLQNGVTPPSAVATAANYYSKAQVDALLLEGGVVKRVFVSSATYTGLLGPATNADAGFKGADAKCQALAKAAVLPGIFKAWVSGNDNTKDVKARFTHSNLKYVLVTGTVIANNWNDLVDGSIAAPINVDENGNAVAGSDVWTGTLSDGGVRDAGADCSSNVAGSSWEDETQFNAGGYGRTDQTDGRWTNTSQKQCLNTARLYCFQQ